MSHPSIVFLDIDPDDASLVTAHFPDAVCLPHRAEAALIDACKDAEVISAFNMTPFPRAVLEQLPRLRLLCTRSVGYDHIDLDACRERDIVVTNVPDYGAHVIAEHAFALLLSAIRRIPEGHARVLRGSFDFHGLRGIALRGKTMGIIGTGKIGQKAAEIAHGFGMNVVAHDLHPAQDLIDRLGARYVELPELYAVSDVISLHAPSLPDTIQMINYKTLAQMKRGVILINTARGNLIDSSDLIDALNERRVQMAVLDVFEHEGQIEKDAELIRHPRTIVTPHVAFYADESIHNMIEDACSSIAQWMEGKRPEHAIGMKS
jgi:D-lactate dehydrogenase